MPADASTDRAIGDRMLSPWREHNVRLAIASVLSIAAAVLIWIFAATPDGRDPWYVAVAIEFFVWGAIDLYFALAGVRGVAKFDALDVAERKSAAVAQAIKLVRLLHLNRYLNALWLVIAVALLAWGYGVHSASLVGHGAGVLIQAMVLVVLDGIFAGALHAVLLGDDSPLKTGEG